ncbi:MAG TPA: sulfatase [Gemmatimonadaceae bacterium]|nr:sulfatase [Gemmatimonadaceae bacterium]
MPERSPAIARPFAIAVIAAIWAGGLHAAIIGVKHAVLAQFVWSSRDVLWMAPLGYLALFGALAVPLAIVAALRPRWMPAGAVLFIFAALTAFSIGLLFPRIHWLASLALALGAGFRLAQWAGDDASRRARRAWRWATAALGLVILLGGAAMRGTRAAREARAIAGATAASPEAPNVLYIILDTVRARSMGIYGGPAATTPELARLAGEGALFRHAFATAPWTLPSHATLLTGKDVAALDAAWLVPLDDSTPTLAEAFAAKGYVTAGFVANHFYTAWETGLDRGFARYDDYRTTFRQVLLSTALLQTGVASRLAAARSWGERLRALASFDWPLHPSFYSDRKDAPMVVDEFLRWQASLADRRFMAFLNFYDAHEPYDPPRDIARQFGDPSDPYVRYLGAIAWIDRELGRLVRELARRGTLDRTVLVVTSDHGEQFGEHGLKGHGNSLYLPVLHVPLVIRYPARVPAGTVVEPPVSLRDLPATVLALAGQATGSPLPGVSLAGTWDGGAPRPSPILAEVRQEEGDRLTNDAGPLTRGDLRSATGDSLHFIRNGDGVEEVYDFRADTAESRNLAPTRGGDPATVLLRERVRAMPAHPAARRRAVR